GWRFLRWRRSFCFCSRADIGFSDATVGTSSFNGGKIDTKLSRNSSRDWRRSYSRFLTIVDLRNGRSFFFFFLSRHRLLRFRLRLLFLFLFGFWFFRFLFFFGRFFLLRSFFAFSADERDLVADVHLPAFFKINFGERAILGRFPFHGRLVGFDLSNHFAGRNFVALLFLPRDEGAFRHGVAQLRHLNLRHKQK